MFNPKPKMLPGQTPYTAEQQAQLTGLVRDAAQADVTEESEAEAYALARAKELGLKGRKPEWLHNLGPSFERRMRAAYAAGKAEKIRLAREAMKRGER